jgi:nucleoid-associated protein YgaU
MRVTRCVGFVLASLLASLVLINWAPGPLTLAGELSRLAISPLTTVNTVGGERTAVVVAASAAWVLLGWITVAGLLVAAAAAPGLAGRAAATLTRFAVPAAARGLLCTVLGVGALAVATSPAMAAAGLPMAGGAPQASPSHGGSVHLNLDWPFAESSGVPRPSLTERTPSTPVPGTPETSPQVPNPSSPPGKPSAPDRADEPERHAPRNPAVIVRPGDSLWSIAARRLGPGAADVRVAQEWPRWWAANRAIVGEDPDLINPGQRLTPPPATTTKEQRP